MKKPFRPMLAANFKDIPPNIQRWPVWATPKFDGIRCITMDGVPMENHQRCIPVCRSLKVIPNRHMFDQIATHCIPGLDGEIMTYTPRDFFKPEKMRHFYEIQSDIMTRDGKPSFKYHVFDCNVNQSRSNVNWGLETYYYAQRIEDLAKLKFHECVSIVLPTQCNNLEELEKFESEQVSLGYEGICYRIGNSPYKYGRSTVNEQWLVKMKRMQTSEAWVIGMDEEMANNNPATLSDLGYAERSSHKENLVGKKRMGALIVRNYDNVEFKIGTGFTVDMRQKFWNERAKIIGSIITYKHQPHGEKDAPRIPVFIGFRGVEDM